MPHQDRLVILHFLTGGAVNATSTTTVAPYHHPAAQIRDYLEKQACYLLLHALEKYCEIEIWFKIDRTYAKARPNRSFQRGRRTRLAAASGRFAERF